MMFPLWIRLNRFNVLFEKKNTLPQERNQDSTMYIQYVAPDGEPILVLTRGQVNADGLGRELHAPQQVLEAEGGSSGDDFRNRSTVHVRQPHVATVEEIGQARVVEPQHVQQRGVDIVVGDDVLGRLISEFVGCPDHLSPGDSRTGHPDGHSAGIVVPADAALREYPGDGCRWRDTPRPCRPPRAQR